MAEDYGKTLNLPKTDFPMRAGLPQREPETLEKWYDMDIYAKMGEKNEGKKKFILHDGPPFANGDIHIGHVLNKVLKDIIIKNKNMSGFNSPYVPGWDTHGLPIERQAIKKLGINRNSTSVAEFRKICREFALSYVDNQRTQFKRLGVFGDWENPYITLNPSFEGKQIEIFGEMAKKGYIYKGLKPVYWCTDCETALAEAEIEYQNDTTNSIYVKFAVKDGKGQFDGIDYPVYFVIWTTTTWTLPGNVAISLNPHFEYSAVLVNGEVYIIATELIEAVSKEAGFTDYEIIRKFKGSDLELITCAHPFLDRDSLVITGEHVTLDAGTGCVHTAPGHGAEDYDACRNYDVPMIVPVDGKGYLNEHAGQFNGMYYEKSNEAIIECLKEKNALLAVTPIEHSYPHCWRCGKPIVYRATDQWFASIDAFKDTALEAIKNVQWIPEWGEDRISSMVSERKDWCISRQRLWGVPIPVFYCADCKKPIIDEKAIDHVAKIFSEKGSNAWHELEISELIPEGLKCECGCEEFTKETDTMDVWFDSGSSHTAVMEGHPELEYPYDLYLEGNDQYRGWFQSSLLTSVAKNGIAPYKAVLTHGMVIDEEKRKMSKSLGNGIAPLEIINEYGADILRLWVASSNYKVDVRISKEILKQLAEGYRKIRNTARFILGSISDFDPNKDMCFEFTEIDKWAMMKLNKLIEKVAESYNSYEHHVVYHSIHNFCVVDLSNFYLDVIKDRVYCEKTDSKQRRAAQTVMYIILDSLVRMLAPILSFTAEEIWSFMPHKDGANTESVFLNDMIKADTSYYSDDLEQKWTRILEVRNTILKSIETARSEKVIGSSLGAAVKITASGEEYDFINSILADLPMLLIVSDVKLSEGEFNVSVTAAEGKKCQRCWMFSDTVGTKHEDLCERCATVLE